MNILLGVTGSVAAIYTAKLVSAIQDLGHTVKVIKTKQSKQFIQENTTTWFSDEHEELYWQGMGDDILHIKLRKWADMMIIAPLSANTMAKIVNGLCDNLLTEIVRAWDYSKPIIVCPSMNSYMIENDPTDEQINTLINRGVKVISPVEKTLACGDTGIGAMCHHDDIIESIPNWSNPLGKDFYLPINDHLGAFGAVRKHDVHTGVDLYCKEDDPVYAVEDSIFVDCQWFTGRFTYPETKWWNDTKCLILRGKSGFVIYGEIESHSSIFPIGKEIKAGQLIGYVKQVLSDSKSRHDIPHHSLSMLHLELHRKLWTQGFIWNVGERRPQQLLNPTPFLATFGRIK